MSDEKVITSVFIFPSSLGVYQISKQIKAHDGSVFTLCQMRNGMLLTGGGKDRKIILWDHDLNPEREIEVRLEMKHKNTKIIKPLHSCNLPHVKINYIFLGNWCTVLPFPPHRKEFVIAAQINLFLNKII
jgi:WD40 repeat protein